jgi:hypothetical protein
LLEYALCVSAVKNRRWASNRIKIFSIQAIREYRKII